MQITTRIVAVAASTALIAGGALLTAPTASAASLPKACNWTWAWPQKHGIKTAVNLRSGPGTKYASLGILYKSTTPHFTEYCNKDFKWDYGVVTSGANKGKKGWVSDQYLIVS
ncbi:SH3 domain-containing protein [Streptomyces griseofuscus]|uniref:SH3 domain-containing protein n=1 Tax=Streptomyces griseofuscus TaxID=146922 RepID=UPI0036C20EC8